MRFQKYSDTCGRSLKLKMTEINITFQVKGCVTGKPPDLIAVFNI